VVVDAEGEMEEVVATYKVNMMIEMVQIQLWQLLDLNKRHLLLETPEIYDNFQCSRGSI
jgi:hypothetical protein